MINNNDTTTTTTTTNDNNDNNTHNNHNSLFWGCAPFCRAPPPCGYNYDKLEYDMLANVR